jgi:hypothetical protein
MSDVHHVAVRKHVLFQMNTNRAKKPAMDATVAEQEKAEWFPGAKALAQLQLVRSGQVPVDQLATYLTTVWTPLEAITPNVTAALATTAAGEIAQLDATAQAAGSRSKSGNVADPWMVWDIMGEFARTAWQASSPPTLQPALTTLARAAAKKSLGSRSMLNEECH